MPKIFLLLCLLWPFAGYSQAPFDASKISDSTALLVREIAKTNVVMSAAVGYGGDRTEQYDRFWDLKNKASEAELIQLTQHPNPTVRCYAFWALAYHPTADLLTPVLQHLQDTQQVETLFGCIGGSGMVGDFFVETVTTDWIDSEVRNLDSTQLAHLDSSLIFTPNPLSARSKALARQQPGDSQYERVRHLALTEHDGNALVALAQYHKVEDVPAILQVGRAGHLENNGNIYVYRAIRTFPHPDFLPFLEQQLRTALGPPLRDANWSGLFGAIAGYQNDKALELLRYSCTAVADTDSRATVLNAVFQAARDNKIPLYADLFLQLWRADRKVSRDVFEFLWAQFPEQALALARRDVLNVNEVFNDNFLLVVSEPEAIDELCADMLDTLVRYDRKTALDAIRENIVRGKVYQYPIFAKKAAELRDSSFIEPLFRRIAAESNPHIYLEAAKALLAYPDPAIRQRLRRLQQSTPTLRTGWGGKALNKLLQ